MIFWGTTPFSDTPTKNSNSMHVLLNPFFWWSYSSPLSQLNHYGWTPHWWIPLSQCSKALQYWFLVGGLEHVFFHSVGEFHHPNWRTHIFQRGRYTTNQIFIGDCRIPHESHYIAISGTGGANRFFWGRRVFPLTIVGSHTGWPPPVVCWFINHYKHH